MKLPFRKTKQAQPIITQPQAQPDPNDQPFQNVETARPVQPELLQMCASCGLIGATIRLKVSYFGYIDLPLVPICEGCDKRWRDAKDQQNTNMHRRPIAAKETIETAVLEQLRARPRRKRLVPMRTPSRPLEVSVHDLAMEA